VTFPAQSLEHRPLDAAALAAALDWWREAGVDLDFAEAPRDWLAPPPADATAPTAPGPAAAPFIAPAAPAPKREPLGGDPASWPQDLPAFAAWWLSEPALDAGQVAGRVPPRGPSGAEVMVLVDHPEAGDSQDLLAGPQGRMVAAILAALGIEATSVYFASALPRHMPLPDWAALDEAGLGDLVRHHVALAAPRRVLAFGPHVSSLLGHDPTKSAEPLPPIHHVGGRFPALAAPGLDALAARPRHKARLWPVLLDWMQG